MEQWTPPDCGALQITNPKTLRKWINNGSYQQLIDEGYIFNTGCGRFKAVPCECIECRKPNTGKTLQDVVNKHYQTTKP